MRYLLILRVVAIGGQVIGLLAAHLLLHTPLPVIPISLTASLLAAFTFVSWRHLHGTPAISEPAFLLQLGVDVIALAILLYFTGGSFNPFVSLFLLPITVAAATLRPLYTWLLVGSAALCYTALMFFHLHTFPWMHENEHLSLHLWGMWFGFLFSAGIVAYFVARIGAALRAQDRALSLARERALEAQQLVALGTLAAGTAHELGTPLATMAVLVEELEHDHANEGEVIDGLTLLRQQIDRCKQTLARMSAQAGQAQADAGRRLRLESFLEDLVREWRQLRPEVQLQMQLSGTQPSPEIIADRTLSQAIVNLLNNAADASPQHVEMLGQWDQRELRLRIRDQGEGLAPAIRPHLGTAFATTKPGGMGLGLYLARTTVEHLGGSVKLNPRGEGAGIDTDVVLPLSDLKVA
jgi:two-component system sensor histidine kinase RegB